MEDFNAYRLCIFWSLVEVEKKSCFEEWNVNFTWMNSLRFNVRSTSSSTTYSRIRGEKSFRLPEKKKNKTNKNKQNKNEEESKQWKTNTKYLFNNTWTIFTFRNCIKDLWGQKLTPPAMGFILSLIMGASYWIPFLTIKYTFGLE